MNPITAWSYSRLTCYEECPAKFKYKNIDKIPEPPAPALERGKALHAEAENFIKFGTATSNWSPYWSRRLGEAVKRGGAESETQKAVTSDWSETGWFDPNVYCRAVFDMVSVEDKKVTMVDFKSGKYRPGTYKGQMDLYAVFGFALYPKVEEVYSSLWFIDTLQTGELMTYNREWFPEGKKYWDTRAKSLLIDTTFPPTPSADSCRWCSFARSKGGPCQFG